MVWRAQKFLFMGGIFLCVTACKIYGASGFFYEVQTHFNGALEEDFKKELLSYQMQDRPVLHLPILKERARKDVAVIEQQLRTKGYFKGQAQYHLVKRPEGMLLIFKVESGHIFPIEKIQFFTTEVYTPIRFLTQARILRRNLGRASTLTVISDIEHKALELLRNTGFSFAKIHEKELIVNHHTERTTFQCTLDAGPIVFFGDVIFIGGDALPIEFLKNRLTFKEGELFDARKIESTRQALVATHLFSSVKVESVPNIDSKRRIPVIIKLKMAPTYLVSLGMHFSTFQTTAKNQNHWQGLKGRFCFSRFNCFGRGDQFQARISGSPPVRTNLNAQTARHDFAIECELIEPDIFSTQHTLTPKFSFLQESTISFFRHGITASVIWDNPISTIIRLITSPTMENFHVKEQKSYTYTLIGLSIETVLDTTNALLDPKHGVRLSLSIHPQGGEILLPDQKRKNGLFLTKGRLSTYYSFDTLENHVIAGWISVRQILGQAFAHIPADKKLYAGGNHSIRGFAYQYAGPFDHTQQYPTGGRSILEWGVEPRLSLTDDLSGVFFIEGAKVSQEFFPRKGDVWFTGIGGGVRYMTPMGPFRIDLGCPLKPRKNIDPKLQFMMSIGQSF
ncbi:MAG: BamA/TamA family outer membrane protein [Holosporales bacterium]|jgi:translocation and assembly module TamA|nr:BamA/TamA family outer membrane protein [Holosporales bacterium]